MNEEYFCITQISFIKLVHDQSAKCNTVLSERCFSSYVPKCVAQKIILTFLWSSLQLVCLRYVPRQSISQLGQRKSLSFFIKERTLKKSSAAKWSSSKNRTRPKIRTFQIADHYLISYCLWFYVSNFIYVHQIRILTIIIHRRPKLVENTICFPPPVMFGLCEFCFSVMTVQIRPFGVDAA